MSGAAERPHHDPLTEAARELQATQDATRGNSRAVPAWARLTSISAGLDRLLQACAAAAPETTKAAEWILDNHYQIKRAVRQVREDLPVAFYRRLPRLANTDLKGFPRAFAVARGFLGTTHLQLSMNALIQFVQAYQEGTPLTIGELWVLPTMLRLVCLETLIISSSELFPTWKSPLDDQTCGCISALDEPTECIARALTGLRAISSIPWKDFFDRASRVESILQRDPAMVYARMDFDTRDRYRRAVEELADGSGRPEWEVAETILSRAGSASHTGRQSHVGYWLLDGGRASIEAHLSYRSALGAGAVRWILRHAGACYSAALAVVGAAALLLPAAYLQRAGATPMALIGGIALCLVPASILSITIIQWIAMLIVPPRVLPKLNFEKGLSPDCPTAVVVPVIVGGRAEVPALMERLELHWLANPDPLLQIALLSDLRDASAERMPEDAILEEALVNGIRRLNARYAPDKVGRFHLLHRARQFNPAEGVWMGWERKRGKLEQFNRLVLGEKIGAFALREGATAALSRSRFVVTVDADTALPPGSVARLAGTLSHPLNAPAFDEKSGKLCAGYTVIQPRVEMSPEKGTPTFFSHVYGGDSAIDIYSRAVSDTYQDLFGSAVYTGKGIYDVAAFHRCLDRRVAENSMLSHDLFEGAHGRAGLATDIVLYDSFPDGYVEYIRRWHRWIRGDWQLLPWLSPRVPAAAGRTISNELPALERWKIFDNLRRSVIPLSLVALAIAGWLALPGSGWVWTALTVAAPGAYLFTDLFSRLAHGHRRGVIWSSFQQFAAHTARWGLAVTFLLHDAMVSLDAIGRTLWRLFVSRRHLLAWTSAAHIAARIAGGSPRETAWREMWPTSAVAFLLAALLAIAHPVILPSAGPLILLWLISPEIAAWISRPRRPFAEVLGIEDRAFLRRIARQTWLFYENFVGPEDNWLPPDNFQEDPRPEIAHRTSPTNVAMYLLSTLTAWDMGYVDSSDLAVRVENCLDTFARLERYRGHFLNWYDTQSLSPLEPRYVSTVDSGNLAVCLITLKECCRAAASAAAFRACQWDGLADSLIQLRDALERVPHGLNQELSRGFETIKGRITQARDKPDVWFAALAGISGTDWPEIAAAIARVASTPNGLQPPVLRRIQVWLERSRHHLERMQRNLEGLYPWLAHCAAPPAGCEDLAGRIASLIGADTSLASIAERKAQAVDLIKSFADSMRRDAGTAKWFTELSAAIDQGARSQRDLRQLLLDVAARAEATAYEMDFALLYDAESRLFHIGYNVSSDRIDQHFYDLLATEARLASYFAIAKRDVPVEHWYFLGRPMTQVGGEPSLLSWNGSMFEYLMPILLMRSSPGTLLARSDRSAVDIQRRYAHRLGVPWGVSESGFAARDSDHHYQYRAFGVPGLGLRRGLALDLVIAPYATALALAVLPVTAVRNLRELASLGFGGLYGFIEAGDFTPERILPGSSYTPVRAYMAHHQGMVLAAIGNALNDDLHVKRFMSDMRMRTVDLLLQERVPSVPPLEVVEDEEPARMDDHIAARPAPRPWRPQYGQEIPQMHLLGNGRFATWISEAGGGGLWWNRQALTRWLPDAARDDQGLWIYIQDQDSGALWSAARQPTCIVSDDIHTIFHPHMAEFHRRDNGIAVRMEVAVAPGDDLEVRRIMIVNESGRSRRLRVTSYGEVVLSPARDDERHPAFSKLFVSSEFVLSLNGVLFSRRPRSDGEHPPTLLHRVIFDDGDPMPTSYETDRAAFLDRNSGPRRPRGATQTLRGTEGWTLDPVMALQLDVNLEPMETRQFAFVTIAGGSRESVVELADRYSTLASLDWAINDAARSSIREAQVANLEPEQLQEVQLLASLLLAPQAAMRAPAAEIAANRLGQPRLWAFGLSGDLPILLLRVSDARDMQLLRLLLRAHKLWRNRSFAVDLVILRLGISGYEEPARERIHALLREMGLQDMAGRNGGIHILFGDQITPEDRHLLESSASVILDEANGPLVRQLSKPFEMRPGPPKFEATSTPVDFPMRPLARPEGLQFANGLGGFSVDGKEYVIHLEAGECTPAPWCNVLANDEFGCLVTEAGGGFTWATNSGENRLSPWTNDPITDPPGEVLYLRDEQTAEIWTPTPAPAGAKAACQVRHGAGYTTWSSRSHGLEHELTIFVPSKDPVKIIRLRLRNAMSQTRRITATYYIEWLLGAMRSTSRQHVVSRYDADSRALFASNSWNPEFASPVAFLASSRPPHSITTDRSEFLGREADLSKPSGLLHWDLGGRVAPVGEPCAAFQVHIEIAPDDSAEVVFVLGEGRDQNHAEALLLRWRDPDAVSLAFEELHAHWDRLLNAVQVRTPDPAFDIMVNRWYLYQSIASRILARAGFYQAGGAIGFRDQLQDVLALLHCDPARARAHILHCAEHQFEEGDVLHWWHPPQGRGVRTRCSDDLLWLPYVTSRYVEATGDKSILSEKVPYLRAAELTEDEGDRFALFETSPERHSLFEHCTRALERGITRGVHQLPLIGSGDWNDGMNLVGAQGRGESVWLGWFAISVMKRFADTARGVDRGILAANWTARANDLRKSIEKAAWDGGWYLRAFDDEGHPWGSASCDECKIDSISQSWAVLSGAGVPDRAAAALNAAQRELVREDDRLIRLLWPPFHDTHRDPGYIKSYPPGIRENGGQYSHAAAWLGLAHAARGDGDCAYRIFSLLNPILRTLTPREVERYRAEPYVLAADISSVPPHVGRGGWSWYTGAAAWTWRLGVEGILGLNLSSGDVIVEPCLPKTWGHASVKIDGPAGSLAISIDDPEHLGHGIANISVEGKSIKGTRVAFPSDGIVRNVHVRLTGKSKERTEPQMADDNQRP